MVENGFDLQRGLPKEEINRQHYSVEEYKKITNFKQTKEVLKNIKLELPDVPDITDININRFSKKRDEKILEEIIKPKDDVIQNLYKDNLNLHRELSRQTKIIEEAEKYQKERDKILSNNEELNNQIEIIKTEYKEKEFDIEWKYKSKIRGLEKENNHLHKVVDKFYETVEKFVLKAEKGITFEVSEGTSGELIIRALNIATVSVYSTNYVNPPIPEGYKHVCGKWNNGFVIERCSDGSQFVWIPVGSLDSNGTLDGEHFSEKFGRRNYRNDEFSDDEFNEALNGELLEQLESVKKYGGFYISRYDISKSSAGKPQSVKGVMPWVNINFDDAKKVASTIEDNEAVKSHLTFGAEYEVYQNDKCIATVSGDKNSYTVNGVDNYKKDYTYYIKAYKNSICVSQSYQGSSDVGENRFRAAKKLKKKKNTITVVNTRTKKNGTAWTVSLSKKDKSILNKFAKKHFKKGWSDMQKAQYTLEWINRKVDYAKGAKYNKIAGLSYVDAIFNKKSGQCLQYNGAYAIMLTYLGYEARIVQGWRGTPKYKWSHYWCEIKIDGKWYLMETGNYKDSGDWSYFCATYRNAGGYMLNGKVAK